MPVVRVAYASCSTRGPHAEETFPIGSPAAPLALQETSHGKREGAAQLADDRESTPVGSAPRDLRGRDIARRAGAGRTSALASIARTLRDAGLDTSRCSPTTTSGRPSSLPPHRPASLRHLVFRRPRRRRRHLAPHGIHALAPQLDPTADALADRALAETRGNAAPFTPAGSPDRRAPRGPRC